MLDKADTSVALQIPKVPMLFMSVHKMVSVPLLSGSGSLFNRVNST